MPAKTLLLIDGHALAFRAFFALSDQGLRSSKGEPTYAVYGFASIMLNAIAEHHPDYLAVSFDIGRTFRDDMYAEYKAGRAETPEEFHPQLERMKQMLAAFNIPIYTKDNYEADDVIGTLARQATAQQVQTLILTGDTDTLQLVDESVRVVLANPFGQKMSTKIYDVAAVNERYKGLRPDQLADLRGLKGDTSDNIPGVKGIGEAGAIALLNQFGTVEQIYDRFDEVPNRYKKPLDGQREAAAFSKKLATIVVDVPVTLDLAATRLHEYDRSAVIALFQELEFGATLLKRLPASTTGVEVAMLPTSSASGGSQQADMFAAAAPTPAVQVAEGTAQLAMFAVEAQPTEPARVPNAQGVYTAVTTQAQLDAVIAALATAPGIAFDTELGGLRPLQDTLVGISLAVHDGTAWYIPIAHREGEQLPRQQVLDALRPFFNDPHKPKYGHNAKFDILALERAGVPVLGVTFDTMLAASLLDKRKGLKELSFYELKLAELPTPIEDLIGRGKAQITFDQVPIERATPYAASDADLTLRLVHALEPQLAALPEVAAIFHDLEMPLLPVLVRMEQAGITADARYLRNLGQRMGSRLGEIEREIYAYNQAPLNINSGDQLSDLLFVKLGLPTDGVPKTDKTKKYSLTADVLEGLREKHQVIDLILQYRQLSKLKSTYVDAIPQLVNPETGRVHTTYGQIGAATGRMSCLPAGTLVNTQHGLVGIEQVQVGDMIQTPFGTRFVTAYQATGDKPIKRVTLSNGLVLECSPDHRLRSGGAWVKAQDAKVGMPLYMTFNSGIFGNTKTLSLEQTAAYRTQKTPLVPTEWSTELAEFVGMVMADGHISSSPYNGKPAAVVLAFGWHDDELIAYMQSIIENLFKKQPQMHVTRTCPILQISSTDIGGALLQLGAGGKSGVIRVPPTLFHAPEPIVAAFLRGYFEGDGYVGEHGIHVRSVSKSMLTDVQLLLTLFGIPSKVLEGTADKRGYAPRHTLRIMSDRAKVTFAQRIGFLSAKKRSALQTLLQNDHLRSTAETISVPAGFDVAALKEFMYPAFRAANGHVQNRILKFASNVNKHNRGITLSRAEQICRVANTDSANPAAVFLQEIVDGQYYEVTIKSIEDRPSVPMYDIAVADVEQYMAQGLVVHNSTDPNLQNIPTRSDEGREVRHAFIAEPGNCFVAADYSQIELRVLAHITQDTALMQAFTEGQDIHAATAARLFGVEPDQVSKNQRRIAKMTVFGIVYGISSFGLAQRTDLSRTDAQEMISGVFASYPGIRTYIDETLARGRDLGFVQSLFGRRRTMADLRASGPRRAAAEREAINAPIQGTAADIMKLAMLKVDAALRESGLQARMLLQVHDELVFECPQAEVPQLAELVQREMEGAFALRVPLTVEVEQGVNWDEMRAVE